MKTLLILEGLAAEQLKREAVEAQRNAEDYKRERLEILESTKNIGDVRNAELQTWAAMHQVKSDVFLDELERTRELRAEHDAEELGPIVPLTPWCERAIRWANKELFGSERISQTFSQDPLWVRDGVFMVGTPRNMEQHLAAGWQHPLTPPRFDEREAKLLSLLEQAYRAGDVPKPVAKLRQALVAVRRKRVELIESARFKLLLRLSTVDSSVDDELAGMLNQRQKLDTDISAIEDSLGSVAMDWRTVR